MKKIIVLCVVLIFLSISSTYAIEVGGHITENTTWSPGNSPYEVTETLIIDEGVTLTVLPGTEIKISGASCTSWMEQSQNFWLYGGVSVAKFIQVEGRIIAEGTEQDSIVFTRLQDNPDYCWGTIYITQGAELCRFTHCRFEYSAGIGLALSNIAQAALSIYNGNGIIHNCIFLNNGASIATYHSYVKYVEILWNTFTFDNNLIDFLINLWVDDLNIRKNAADFKTALVADNTFFSCIMHSQNSHFVDNTITNTDHYLGSLSDRSYFYGNIFIDCLRGIKGGSEYDSIYVKNNRFIDGTDGIYVDYAYIEIVDNYFEGCEVYLGGHSSGLVYNNIVNDGEFSIFKDYECFQNIFYNFDSANNAFTGSKVHNINNIFCNNTDLFYDHSDTLLTNCVIIKNENLIWCPCPHGQDIFRNCIIDFPLEYPLIDGGGNIIVDSLQAQQIFVDIENGDFHLTEGSIAIDAGFDTLGYYYPFDIEYHTRVWDGNGDGNAIIDIGAYEYGAPSFGGIQGYTYNPISGERVDYLFIKINNDPGEFTFSDSIGNFEYKLPAGAYDVYAERVFYDDVIEYNVEVIDGQFTQIDIPMTETYDVDEPGQEHGENDLFISAYPNPFSTSTMLSFSLTKNLHELSQINIYNIKGQIVRKLRFFASSLSRFFEVVWDGKDANGNEVGTGVYFYKINNDEEHFGKVVKLR